MSQTVSDENTGRRGACAVFTSNYAFVACGLLSFFALLFLLPPFQTLAVSLGERLKGRPLNHAHWQLVLRSAGVIGIIFVSVICAFLLLLRRCGSLGRLISAINSRELNGRKLGSVPITLCFFILTLILAFMNITDGHDWGDDFAEYIQQGITIANGTYAAEYLGRSIFVVTPHGFPLLIAAVYKLFGFNLLAFKMINVVMYAVFVSVLFYFCDKKCARITALAVAFLFACSPCLFLLVDCILSDTVALAFTFIALACMVFLFDAADSRVPDESESCGKAADGRLTKAGSRKLLLLSFGTGFFSFCSYVCRDSGIVLLCTLACVQLLRLAGWWKGGRLKGCRKQGADCSRIIAAILPYLVFALCCFLMNSVLFPPSERKQFDLFRSLTPAGMASNFLYYCGIVSRFFYPQFIWFVLFPAVIWAMVKLLHKDCVFIIYLLGLIALYTIWPGSGQGVRYIVSALPILLFFAGRAAELLASPHGQSVSPQERPASPRPLFVFNWQSYAALAGFSCLCFLSISVVTGVRNVMSGRYVESGGFTEEAKEMYRYIDETIADDESIYFFKPRLLLIMTGNEGVYFSSESGHAQPVVTTSPGAKSGGDGAMHEAESGADALGFHYYLHTFDRGYGQLLSDEQARGDSFFIGDAEFTC
ncbi:MAG: hypothetical protein J6Y13_10025, partial [Treponema sp.]|nr:hypothetical protein [Treponema sp.]